MYTLHQRPYVRSYVESNHLFDIKKTRKIVEGTGGTKRFELEVNVDVADEREKSVKFGNWSFLVSYFVFFIYLFFLVYSEQHGFFLHIPCFRMSGSRTERASSAVRSQNDI